MGVTPRTLLLLLSSSLCLSRDPPWVQGLNPGPLVTSLCSDLGRVTHGLIVSEVGFQ